MSASRLPQLLVALDKYLTGSTGPARGGPGCQQSAACVTSAVEFLEYTVVNLGDGAYTRLALSENDGRLYLIEQRKNDPVSAPVFARWPGAAELRRAVESEVRAQLTAAGLDWKSWNWKS